jgi:hypothetical protein
LIRELLEKIGLKKRVALSNRAMSKEEVRKNIFIAMVRENQKLKTKGRKIKWY